MLEGKSMLVRCLSRCVSLALVASVTLGASSCLFGREDHAAPAVTVEDEAFVVQPRSERQRFAPREPEYFEGAVAPEPPAAQSEERPRAPSAAHVWIAGHHTRQDSQWVWVKGHYAVPPRADDVWVPGHWVGHLRGYVWIEGGWR